jgi:hypothetical protein
MRITMLMRITTSRRRSIAPTRARAGCWAFDLCSMAHSCTHARTGRMQSVDVQERSGTLHPRAHGPDAATTAPGGNAGRCTHARTGRMSLSRRKEIYEILHPETKAGYGPGRGHKEKKRQDGVSFTEDTASKTGQSRRTIERKASIGPPQSHLLRSNAPGRCKHHIRSKRIKRDSVRFGNHATIQPYNVNRRIHRPQYTDPVTGLFIRQPRQRRGRMSASRRACCRAS